MATGRMLHPCASRVTICVVTRWAAASCRDQQHAVDAEDIRDGLARSLAEGNFRLVVVLDSEPDELVQVVGYLQSVTDEIDIYLG